MRRFIGFFVAVIVFGHASLLAQHFDYASHWVKIDSLEMEGLPNSALTVAGDIFRHAKSDKEYPQVVKAFIYKMKYRSIMESDVFTVNLEVAERMADSVSFPVKPVIHSMLAEMYWWYFQNNRSKFYNRSQTSAFTPTDIKTWDMNRIVAKVIAHYKLSIEGSDELKAIDMEPYSDILYCQGFDEKNGPRTLYDYLALRAIDFFKSEEPGLIRLSEEFSMDNEDYFIPADSFSKIEIHTPDTMSFRYYALTMLQDLVKSHLNDSLPGFLVEVDLKRLEFVNQKSSITNKDYLYLKSLNYLESKSAAFECSAKVGLTIAEKIYGMGEKYNPRISENYKWEKKKALEKCLAVEKKYPDADCAYNHFKDKVKHRNAELTIEETNLPNEPFRALVAYQNTDSLYVKIIHTSYAEFNDIKTNFAEQRRSASVEWNSYLIDYFKKKKTAKEFTVLLPDDQDYQKHYTEIKIPALEKGLYFIMTCSSADWDYKKQAVNYGFTAVTNLSYFSRANKDGSNDFYLLHRKTGLPLENVKVSCFTSNYDYKTRTYESDLEKEYVSDENGFVHIAPDDFKIKSFWLHFFDHEDEWDTQSPDQFNQYGQFYSYSQSQKADVDEKTFFFTDRSIYRPGQTIYFKGITLETDGKQLNKIVTGEEITVALNDANGQQVSELKMVTNEYGSFTGSFMAPATGLNGKMTIEDEDNDGSISFSVEDYKRPKFEVRYDTLKTSYKLGQMVKATGYAISYSGVAIDNASVKYRVVRQVRFNWWWDSWWNPRPVLADKEITHGTSVTGKDGVFDINFKAIPDESVSVSSNPTFTYVVSADVTDINGETHSSEKRISIGYKALLVKPEIPDIVDKNGNSEFEISTRNQNGDFVAASGHISISKLKSPDRIYRDRKWEKADKYILSRKEYNEAFPFDQYDDELNPTFWAIEKTVYETSFNSGNSKTVKFPDLKKWPSGMYKYMVTSRDIYGEPVEQTVYFNLYDKSDHNLPYPMANWYVASKEVCEPDEKAEITAGSGYGAHVLFEVESDGKIVEKKWVDMGNEQRTFTHLIKEEYRGNIGIHYTFVRNNRMYSNETLVQVPYTNKALDIRFETFRNKLQPGEKEQWKLHIKGKNGDKTAAEMVATLYDESLDAFAPHAFNFNIWPYYSPTLSWKNMNGFNAYSFQKCFQKYEDFNTAFVVNKCVFNWFGFAYNVSYFPARYKYEGVSGTNQSTYKIVTSLKQKGTDVSGTIYDASAQEPLIGVSIVLNGSTSGTISGKDGKFQISSTSNDVELVFSYIGYVSEKVHLTNKGKVNLLVNLAPDMRSLEEVVVVGYGVQRKENITGSVSTITIRGTSSISDALQGSLPGIVITKMSQDLKEKPDLSNIRARTNLNETAFFYPQLHTDEHGDVLINFTIPEATTRWKMLGFAHTKELAYGFTQNELVTQKKLMVTPNAPRFFRENDTITFTAKVTSLSDENLDGSAQLMLFDALTMKPVDVWMHNDKAQQSFVVKKGESANLNWNIIIPAGLQAVAYRVVAQSGKFSDGEESSLPVLTNSMLVTETLPLPVKGRQTKTYTLDKLLHNTSTTLRSHKLTLEFTSNPAWYAIQALPYLMEYPYECAEQTFSRFYANNIASYIANSSPRIKQVFDSWKMNSPDALLSNLEKNQELKGLMLEETPWVCEAKNESERKQRVALLFDLNRMSNELDRIRVTHYGNFSNGITTIQSMYAPEFTSHSEGVRIRVK
jgi:hypothetical protein